MKKRFTEELKQKIRKLKQEGVEQKYLAERFDCSQAMISIICREKTNAN